MRKSEIFFNFTKNDYIKKVDFQTDEKKCLNLYPDNIIFLFL